MNKINIFVKSILIPVLVGTLVGLVISGNIDYSSLQQPSFAPPAIVFPIVWTLLYILMVFYSFQFLIIVILFFINF